MTLYCIKDPTGNMCSDACWNEWLAWSSCTAKELNGKFFNKGVDEIKAHLEPFGYTIVTVGCYDPSTQVVIDREAYDLFSFAVNNGRAPQSSFYINGVHISASSANKFLSAGEVKK